MVVVSTVRCGVVGKNLTFRDNFSFQYIQNRRRGFILRLRRLRRWCHQTIKLNGRREIDGGRTISTYVRQRHEDSNWVVVGTGVHAHHRNGTSWSWSLSKTRALGHGSGTTGPRHRSGASAATLPFLFFFFFFFMYFFLNPLITNTTRGTRYRTSK